MLYEAGSLLGGFLLLAAALLFIRRWLRGGCRHRRVAGLFLLSHDLCHCPSLARNSLDLAFFGRTATVIIDGCLSAADFLSSFFSFFSSFFLSSAFLSSFWSSFFLSYFLALGSFLSLSACELLLPASPSPASLAQLEVVVVLARLLRRLRLPRRLLDVLIRHPRVVVE